MMLCTEATPLQAARNRRANLPHYVYALVDPFTEAVRYIGMSRDPWARLRGHCKKPMTEDMRQWIRGLYREHRLRPRLAILAECESHYRAGVTEQAFIHEYSNFHGGLFNRQDMVQSWENTRTEIRVRDRLKAIRKSARREVHPLKVRPTTRHRVTAQYFLNGKRVLLADEAKRLGISRQAVHQRLQRYSPEIALSVGRMPSGIAIAPRELQPRKPYKVLHGIRYTHDERRVRRARMAEMVFPGFTIELVAKEFSVTTGTVKTACKENGVALQEAAT